MNTFPFLSLILFLPVAGAIILLLLPGSRPALHRWGALITSLITFVLALVLWSQFDVAKQGFQFVENVLWYAPINASYHVGVDGLSLPMVLLTTLLTPLALVASFNITERVKPYMILFLLLEMGMLGVFLSLDLMLFFVFWEIGLVPMYFLIAQWGSKNRNYASLKFMLYTIGGSLGLLLSIQLIGVLSGTFDLVKLFQTWPTLTEGSLFGVPYATVKTVAFWAFVIAFAIKVPVWPFHTWLPDAHTEAPTAGSMILAGVLLKLGAYGFLRLVLPLFPAEAHAFAGVLAALAVAAIIFGALSAYGQTDFKRLVAYSSINHMGFVVLGIAAAADAGLTPDSHIALNGAVLQMVTHGLSSAGMFFLVGVLYDRTHTRDLRDFGGLFALMPKYGTILLFTAMASLGLPGLAGFVSEFMVVRGSWPILPLATALATIGLFFTGAYILKALKLVLHGPLNEKWTGKLSEINGREMVVIAPLMVLMLAFGIWPAWIVDMINRAVGWLF
ncbi:MAG TPA: NADH-quinone oxidoreductase subunit M [Anaerolineaceae bacterium]|nr:NADH-quinone oxidoreductase subunit M [Anaerolineaceae bacterium]